MVATPNLSGAPAYNRPDMSSYYQQVGVGPSGGLVSQAPRQAIDMNLVNQQSNQLRNSLMQQAQGQSVRLGNSMANRGFGSNSPAMIAQQSNLEAMARNQGSSAALQNRLQAYQANNQMASQWDQNYRQNELQRMQMAMGLSGQDQQLYGQQLGYLTSQQQMANDKSMQEAALANQLRVAQISAQAQMGQYGQQQQGIPGQTPGWVQTPFGPVYAPGGASPGMFR
jgi:hypothetical protein